MPEFGHGSASNYNYDKILNPDGSVVTCSQWGCDLARGAFKWPFGTSRIAIYVKLNTVGSRNGEFALYINEVLCCYYSGIFYRTTKDLRISGILFSTFFGGGDVPEYYPSKIETITFSNFAYRY
jgi:hypothetical protein